MNQIFLEHKYSFRDYFFRPQHSFFSIRKSRRTLFFFNLSVNNVQYLRKLKNGFLDPVCKFFYEISSLQNFFFGWPFYYSRHFKTQRDHWKHNFSCVVPQVAHCAIAQRVAPSRATRFSTTF
jgi:hypothetical protein